MSKQDIFEQVKKIIIDELEIDEAKITMEARLADDLGADSLDAVELVMNVEDTFNIKVSDDEAQKIKTVGDIVNYIAVAKA